MQIGKNIFPPLSESALMLGPDSKNVLRLIESISLRKSNPMKNGKVNYTNRWHTKNRITKNRITKNRITKSWITKNRITKSWITKNRITKNRIIKSWITKNWITKSWITKKTNSNPRLVKFVPESRVSRFAKKVREYTSNELSESVVWLMGRYGRVVQCAECGVKSGTLLVLNHYYGCSYWKDPKHADLKLRVYDESVGRFFVSSSGPEKVVGMFKPFAKVDSGSMGSFGAGPCVVCAVRDPQSHSTWMSHLDSVNFLSQLRALFKSLPKDRSLDLYLCGGDANSLNLQLNVLVMFKKLGLDVNYRLLHLNDTDSNQLTVDADSGNYSMDPWDFSSTKVM